MNIVEDAIRKIGSDYRVAKSLKKPDGKAPCTKTVRKWRILGRMPWSELTGKTNYAEQMANLNPEIDKEKLLQTAIVKKR